MARVREERSSDGELAAIEAACAAVEAEIGRLWPALEELEREEP